MQQKKSPAKTGIQLVISGGQSGADLAGNEFARMFGLATRCYVFEGFKPLNPEDVVILSRYEQVNIKVSNPNDYPSCLRDRTVFNVKRADATVIFLDQRELQNTRGSKLTWAMCDKLKKPHVVVSLKDPREAEIKVAEMLKEHQPKILNVAGERTCMRDAVIRVLHRAMFRLR